VNLSRSDGTFLDSYLQTDLSLNLAILDKERDVVLICKNPTNNTIAGNCFPADRQANCFTQSRLTGGTMSGVDTRDFT